MTGSFSKIKMGESGGCATILTIKMRKGDRRPKKPGKLKKVRVGHTPEKWALLVVWGFQKKASLIKVAAAAAVAKEVISNRGGQSDRNKKCPFGASLENTKKLIIWFSLKKA